MNAYELAKARYAALGVDTEAAIGRLAQKAISIPVSYTHLTLPTKA